MGYTVAGAFIFIEVEGDTEKLVRKHVANNRNVKAEAIWLITNKTNIFDELLWKARITMELLDYQRTVTHAIKNGFDGFDNLEDNKSWTFPGAFLYSLTVITTIGE